MQDCAINTTLIGHTSRVNCVRFLHTQLYSVQQQEQEQQQHSFLMYFPPSSPRTPPPLAPSMSPAPRTFPPVSQQRLLLALVGRNYQ